MLLLHSADRRWHFPDGTVRVGRRWDDSLRSAVGAATGIEDLTLGPVLLVQKFDPGEVAERPQFGIFFLCTTHTPDTAGVRSNRWIHDPAELEGLELFHPLIADLIRMTLDDPPGAR